jgi:hypothetical protein
MGMGWKLMEAVTVASCFEGSLSRFLNATLSDKASVEYK